jgi:hypothetical protein
VNDLDFINLTGALQEVGEFFTEPNAYRSILILFASILAAYWVSKLVANLIVRFAQVVSSRGDQESDESKLIRYRELETYLSVAIAVVRVGIIAIVAYLAWNFLSPISSSDVAAIGAGTIFIVLAGQTLGMILRDLTAGTTMIAEKWFKVGDFIKVEPYMDVTGVVERMTLRSTKIRRLSGEVVWMHNQQILAVHVTPGGLRTMAVDVFVHDKEIGKTTVNKLIRTIPTGPTMLARPLRIKSTEEWGEDLWRITIIGQTPPGREWLIEKYFIDSLKQIDEDKPKDERIFVLEPIARYADTQADKRFSRTVRVKRED